MKRISALALALLLVPSFALAAEPGPPSGRMSGLVEAIARQESGLNPLAINVAGKSYYPPTQKEAEAIIQTAKVEGKSFDVGLMQINSWWMERYGIPPASLLDPKVNQAWGEWILTQEIARHGLNWQAIGKYHSPDAERGRRYAWLVYRHYAGQSASNPQKEAGHAQQKAHTQNLPQPGGIWRNPGVRQQGRIVTLDLQ